MRADPAFQNEWSKEMHLRLSETERLLPTPDGKRFITLFSHDMVTVEMYAPRGTDPQEPHNRDEAYVVAKGTGTFFDGNTRTQFGPGDLLFVPAHVPHRFEDFSDDLVVWVLFIG
jgi:mannose-6-phosphate isomerase-like protein (cupin superfamily)